MKLYMKQKVFSWRDKFTIQDETGMDWFYAEGEFFSWGKRLHVMDHDMREVAFIREKVMSWMPQYIVETGGQEVCRIVKRFTLFKPRYELEGMPWHIEGDFWSHEYAAFDNGRQVMRLSKHWFTWGDSYEMDIARPEDALLCLCVVLAIDAAMASADAANSGGA